MDISLVQKVFSVNLRPAKAPIFDLQPGSVAFHCLVSHRVLCYFLMVLMVLLGR